MLTKARALDARSTRAPETLRVGYLAGTPCSIFQNYKAIISSMHARLHSVSAGRSDQTKYCLADVGRKLFDVGFIAFSAFLDDLLGGSLRPFTALIQTAVEPPVFARAQRRIMQRLRDVPTHLRYVRRLLRVISLCRQWVPADELGQLWLAHSSSRVGMMLPNFWRTVGEILASATPCYQGVELARPEFLDPSKSHCLGPHCQFLWRIAAAASRQRGAPRGQIGNGIPIRVRGRRVLVPPWVAHGDRRLRPHDGDLVGVSAR